MATKYLDYAGLQRVIENIDRKYAPISAIVFKSTVDDIANLPALNTVKAGWMYNIKTGGLTTADFVEGAGHIVADGENIAAVELVVGSYTAVASVSADDDPKAKGWYEVSGTPVAVTPVGTENPSAEGWYELSGSAYVLSADTTVNVGKTYYEVAFALSTDRIADVSKVYYEADTVMKWDLMGGVFDLEDRYLEFGDEFPQGPASRLVDGRTFLYMGDDVKVYAKVASPSGRPTENNYFELDSATAVSDRSTIYNPKQQALYEKEDDYVVAIPSSDPQAEGLYEFDGTNYVLTADNTPQTGKTYYEKVDLYVHSQDITDVTTKTYYVCTFDPSTDVVVDAGKIYYAESDAYKKAVIYQYDATAQDWIAQSSSGSGDMVPITTAEIDDLFI